MPSLLNRAFLRFREDLRAYQRRRTAGLDSITLEGALARAQQRGLKIDTVIDIGASSGIWSKVCLHYFPAAYYFLIEAQGSHEPKLQQFKRQHPRSDYVISAAGDSLGEIHFDATSLFGGVASREVGGGKQISVPMNTVDNLVRERRLKPPFLLKLDTHGFEVPIFEGATETLRETSLIIVETYNFQLSEGALRFPEMCVYLETKGFRCIDFSDLMHRQRDGAFWQWDLYFLPATDPVFSSNTYE